MFTAEQPKDGETVLLDGGTTTLEVARALIGRPELPEDPRFKANADRVKNNEQIVAILQAEIAKRTTDDWMATLEKEGIPAGPVLHHDEVFADPQILARGMVAEVEGDRERVVKLFPREVQLVVVSEPERQYDAAGDLVDTGRMRSKIRYVNEIGAMRGLARPMSAETRRSFAEAMRARIRDADEVEAAGIALAHLVRWHAKENGPVTDWPLWMCAQARSNSRGDARVALRAALAVRRAKKAQP